jgi:hypothetical protein
MVIMPSLRNTESLLPQSMQRLFPFLAMTASRTFLAAGVHDDMSAKCFEGVFFRPENHCTPPHRTSSPVSNKVCTAPEASPEGADEASKKTKLQEKKLASHSKIRRGQ